VKYLVFCGLRSKLWVGFFVDAKCSMGNKYILAYCKLKGFLACEL